jgi:hypothetical protein
MRLISLLLLSSLLSGCNSAAMQGFAQGLSQGAARQAPASYNATSSSRSCPTCGLSMHWTGQTHVEWGKLRYLHACPAGHQYYYNTSSTSAGTTGSTSKSVNANACPVCGMGAYFTGETYVEWGKLHYVYACPASHQSVRVK